MSEQTWKVNLNGEVFTTDELITAGRVLGVLADDAQERAIKALREGEFEKAKDQQRVADILSGMDVERIFRQGGDLGRAFTGLNPGTAS